MGKKKREVTGVYRDTNGVAVANLYDRKHGNICELVILLNHWELGDAMKLLGLNPAGLSSGARVDAIWENLKKVG